MNLSLSNLVRLLNKLWLSSIFCSVYVLYIFVQSSASLCCYMACSSMSQYLSIHHVYLVVLFLFIVIILIIITVIIIIIDVIVCIFFFLILIVMLMVIWPGNHITWNGIVVVAAAQLVCSEDINQDF